MASNVYKFVLIQSKSSGNSCSHQNYIGIILQHMECSGRYRGVSGWGFPEKLPPLSILTNFEFGNPSLTMLEWKPALRSQKSHQSEL